MAPVCAVSETADGFMNGMKLTSSHNGRFAIEAARVEVHIASNGVFVNISLHFFKTSFQTMILLVLYRRYSGLFQGRRKLVHL